PPHLSLQRLPADPQPACAAARLRRPSAPHRDRQRGPAVAARGPGRRARGSSHPLVRRHRRRLRPPGGAPVPAGPPYSPPPRSHPRRKRHSCEPATRQWITPSRLFQRKGWAHASDREQGGCSHSTSARRRGLEHDGEDGAVHWGLARDGAFRGHRAREAGCGDPHRRAQPGARGRGGRGDPQYRRFGALPARGHGRHSAGIRAREAVLARSERIDVLIHSAGGIAPSGARTLEGVDRGFAQNFLGAFLLTRLLEERLVASAPARVIAVGSSTHRLVKSLHLDQFLRARKDLSRKSSYQRGSYQMLSYQTAKLAGTTWTYGLARRWAGRGVTANVLDPGIVKGAFGKQFEGPAPLRVLMTHVVPFLIAVDAQRSSEQYVRLATDPGLATVSGRYFVSG